MTFAPRFFPLVVGLTLAAGAAVVPFAAHASTDKGPIKIQSLGICPAGYTKTEKTNGENYSYTCTSEKITCDNGFSVQGWQVPGTPVTLSPTVAFAEERPYPSRTGAVISFTCNKVLPTQ